MNAFISLVLNWLKPLDNAPVEIRRAKQLIAAIDAGGTPLDSARISRIAEDLGLEVSKKARMEDTIDRIRMALKRY
ncbi:hypothetical protein SCD_n01555 [Sulfuricella denitrificans skB26]|uniref:Uncharacterized protein n=1 Tax=Sulfuricella denitrificans (strain DSM 22764 / NBRC 105220 / skB26) TaxID=1163617 RepID=S6AH18_SULDS|nr:hypothetical protein [Sulfuricella denitrificans]BAN35376.1 hypothetical protein SCD_n01555 [Sulfuricella denitrificans skB26]